MYNVFTVRESMKKKVSEVVEEQASNFGEFNGGNKKVRRDFHFPTKDDDIVTLIL